MKKTIIVIFVLAGSFLAFKNVSGTSPIAEKGNLVMCCNHYDPFYWTSEDWNVWCDPGNGRPSFDLGITRNCCMSLWAMHGYTAPPYSMLCSLAQPCPKY